MIIGSRRAAAAGPLHADDYDTARSDAEQPPQPTPPAAVEPPPPAMSPPPPAVSPPPPPFGAGDAQGAPPASPPAQLENSAPGTPDETPPSPLAMLPPPADAIPPPSTPPEADASGAAAAVLPPASPVMVNRGSLVLSRGNRTSTSPRFCISSSRRSVSPSPAHGDEGNKKVPLDPAKAMRLRAACVAEIITTEQAYLDDLKIIEEVFMLPMRVTHTLREDEIARLYSNVELLYPIHKELLDKLMQSVENKDPGGHILVGDIFKAMCQYLKIYKVYCANQDQALHYYEELVHHPEFVKTLEICNGDYRIKGLPLTAYIIKPVQRICKYPLFFRELLRHTPPEHEDYVSLTEAQKEIDEVVQSINEGKRQAENQQKILEISHQIEGELEEALISPTRRFVSQHSLMACNSEKGSKPSTCDLWVFSDLVLLTKRLPSSKKPHKLVLFIPLAECTLEASDNRLELRRVCESNKKKQALYVLTPVPASPTAHGSAATPPPSPSLASHGSTPRGERQCESPLALAAEAVEGCKRRAALQQLERSQSVRNLGASVASLPSGSF
eukprot:TRINITY_DN974_c0_g1_i15.p1 TRINITY_DN974_c0_g1~~TRINITY_DN974_c0_g1_i15.p1  ORF type:complete len:557 (-),score=166.34 TRINITY_DN974_c0_g1_i15:706-2376(-)